MRLSDLVHRAGALAWLSLGTVACLLGGCHHATLSSRPRPLPPVKLAPVRLRSPGLASATIEDAGASPFEVAVTGEGIRPQRLGRSWLLTRDESYAQHDASGWRLGCLPPESALAGSPEHLWMITKFNSFVLALNECPEASDGQSILAERWAAGARQSSVDRLPLDEPDLDLDPAISQEPAQIGRASCRERG